MQLGLILDMELVRLTLIELKEVFKLIFFQEIEGKTYYGKYCIITNTNMEFKKQIPPCHIEDNKIICYSVEERDLIVGKLNDLSVSHSIEDLSARIEIIEKMKEDKRNEINQKCRNSIFSGFKSVTTGHKYGYKEHDQINFNEQKTDMISDQTITSVEWKTEDAGVVVHSRDDFLKVCDEAKIHRKSNMEKYWTIESLIESATTIEELDSIYW